MGLLELVLVIVLIMCLFGGGYGYTRRADWGVGPPSVFGVVLLVILIILLMRVI